MLRVLIQDKMGIMNPTTQFLKEPSAEGEFERKEDAFRELVTSDGSSLYPGPDYALKDFVAYALGR